LADTAEQKPSPAPDAIVITGATATGKSATGVALAEAVNGEVISLDSRQIYRGMTIGTAKPDSLLRERVRHHAIDIIDPNQRYSAGRFAEDARDWIADIQARGKLPILVGGTGFFLKALTQPMFREPELPLSARTELRAWLAAQSTEELQRWLDAIDPESAESLRHAGGRQRKTRALEIALLTGHPIGWWHRQSPALEPPLTPLVFVLELPRVELYTRINQRVRDMIAAGLVQEVEELLTRGYDQNAPGMNATGYIELIPYLRSQVDLESAIDAIQRATRRYARRQHTWFRHQLPPGAHSLDARQPVSQLVQTIMDLWKGIQ
jgi:tRNA dimethylallyltransferase